MDIAFDRKSWTGDPASKADGKSGSPEWHGLLARLRAARSARLVLSQDDTAGAGSFDCGSARALADYDRQLMTVNPVFWANGKPARSMDAGVAGETSPGERG